MLQVDAAKKDKDKDRDRDRDQGREESRVKASIHSKSEGDAGFKTPALPAKKKKGAMTSTSFARVRRHLLGVSPRSLPPALPPSCRSACTCFIFYCGPLF